MILVFIEEHAPFILLGLIAVSVLCRLSYKLGRTHEHYKTAARIIAAREEGARRAMNTLTSST